MSSTETAEVFKDGKWYHEKLKDGLVYSYQIKNIAFSGNSTFQKVEVLDTIPFSRILLNDGLLQSTYSDEYVYHECLVHPALVAHGNPKRVYIGGGGEGATLRECLKHSSVQKVIMVDIDGICVEQCKVHMPKHSAGAFEDPRTDLRIDDAKVQLEKEPDGSLDVIILDLCDPLDGGPCYQLYTVEFYEMCKRKLTSDGALVTQSGWASIADIESGVCGPVNCTLKQVFPQVHCYTVYIPSFCSEWGFNVALKNPNSTFGQNLAQRKDIDERLQQLNLTAKLRYYDQVSHTKVFSLVKSVREFLAKENRVMTIAKPLFMTNSNVGILK
jgi:thermospermine synthase